MLSRKITFNFRRITIYGILIGSTFFFIIPLFWVFISSMKNPAEMFQIPPTLLPKHFTLRNYTLCFFQMHFLGNIGNSFLLAFISTTTSVFLGSLAAYGFAQYPFKGSKELFLGILSMRMMPVIALAIPFYVILKTFGLLDNIFALIIIYIGFQLPLVVWIMEGFFKNIPGELQEAALLDGCSRISAFFYVILPIAIPGLVAAAILTFFSAWNELLLALTLTTSTAKTAPVALAETVSTWEIRWGELFAGAVIFILPAVFLSLFAQKYIIKGLLAGSVRG